jgi:hypothetical protein
VYEQNYSRLLKNRTISAAANTNQKASKRSFCAAGRMPELKLFQKKAREHPVPLLTVLPVANACNSGYHVRRPMADPKSFLDNLNNLRLVTSVALEHIQAHLTNFVKDADANQSRQCDKSINQIRTLSEQLKREFNTLEYLVAKRHT